MSGETAQALGGPGGQVGGPQSPNQLQAKFSAVTTGATELLQILMRVPGVDQAAIKEGAQKLSEGMVLIARAVQGAQSAPGAMPTPAQPGPR